MANRTNMTTNRWYNFAHSVATQRHNYSEHELILRVIQMMELAYGEGKREARKEPDHG